jgi:hypothetical protein
MCHKEWLARVSRKSVLLGVCRQKIPKVSILLNLVTRKKRLRLSTAEIKNRTPTQIDKACKRKGTALENPKHVFTCVYHEL